MRRKEPRCGDSKNDRGVVEYSTTPLSYVSYFYDGICPYYLPLFRIAKVFSVDDVRPPRSVTVSLTIML